MKLAVGLALLAFAPLTLSAADTAYTALRIVGKKQGADALNRVVEVRGRSGTPEPQVWKIVLADDGARGGLLELDVQRGKVIGERTPVSRPSGKPINFTQLNLDSEGAYTVATQEAQKVPTTFNRVDYTLQGGQRGPIWHLELFDGGNGVGSLDIAADNGAVIRRDLRPAVAPQRGPARDQYEDDRVPPPSTTRRDDRRYRDDVPPPPPYDDRYEDDRYDDRYDDRRYDDRRRDGRSFGQRFKDHFERRGSQIKRFFLGD